MDSIAALALMVFLYLIGLRMVGSRGRRWAQTAMRTPRGANAALVVAVLSAVELLVEISETPAYAYAGVLVVVLPVGFALLPRLTELAVGLLGMMSFVVLAIFRGGLEEGLHLAVMAVGMLAMFSLVRGIRGAL